MAKTYEITDFKKRETGAKEFITKFGGSPDWIKEEEWPLSLGWEDRKMTFVGQIYLKKDMLGNDGDYMVYLFMTQPESFDDDFFDPDIAEWDGGENAVVIQAFDNEKTPLKGEEGPALFDENNEHFEYIPVLRETLEPDALEEDAYSRLSDEQKTRYFDAVDRDKIDGAPAFFQADERPEGEWKLLLQLHCNFQPFVLRAGAMPTLFVFLSEDLKEGGMLVQDA